MSAILKEFASSIGVVSKLACRIGRYEYRDDKSDKFWQISIIADSGSDPMILAEWGKIGCPPQGKKIYSQTEALHKVAEKMGKGYRQIEDSMTVTLGDPNDGSIPVTLVAEEDEDNVIDFMAELKKIKN